MNFLTDLKYNLLQKVYLKFEHNTNQNFILKYGTILQKAMLEHNKKKLLLSATLHKKNNIIKFLIALKYTVV